MDTPELPSRNLRLVESSAAVSGPPEGRPWLLVHALRTAFLICILLVSVGYQIHLGNFVNTEIWIPVYAVLFVDFLLNSGYLLFFDRWQESRRINGFLFALDAFAITLLIYFTGTNQSLFLFLYLINLLLASLVFDAEGTWRLVVWTSACFSALLVASPDVSGQNLYFSVAINNLAFVAVAVLGTKVRAQLALATVRLEEVNTDFENLRSLSESIVGNMTGGVIVVTKTDFVQYHNAQAEALLGRERLVQMKINDVFPELAWPWDSLTGNGALEFERREVGLTRGEFAKILEVVVTRFKDADNRARGWLLLIDDRTQQKALEETLRTQQKLAAVGQLAAGIAHEIRNPLASISGSIQMMLTNPGAHSEDDTKLMRIVDREIDRLNGLITEFLEYARPEPRVETPVNLNAVIREVVESLQFNTKLRKDIVPEMKLRAHADVPGNRDKLKQVLLNLVINACQAMDKTERPKLKIETQDEGALVVFILRDNGCGIKPENLNRIWEPFHTTKAQGTGLGLAITHKILEAHSARVLVDSEVGVGTRFLIEFPAHRDFHTEDLIRIKDGSNG